VGRYCADAVVSGTAIKRIVAISCVRVVRFEYQEWLTIWRPRVKMSLIQSSLASFGNGYVAFLNHTSSVVWLMLSKLESLARSDQGSEFYTNKPRSLCADSSA
jgi:hypothetical protein